MNFLDIILLCILAIFLVRGLFRGLVQEILSLVAIVLAVYLASNFQHLLIPHLEIYIKSDLTVGALSYIIIFFGTIILFWLLAKVIRTMLEISLGGWLDRIAGGIFGLLEGALIALIALMFLQSFAPESDALKDSYIAPRSQHLVEYVGKLTPQSMRDMLKERGIELPSAEEALDTAREAVGLDDEPAAE